MNELSVWSKKDTKYERISKLLKVNDAIALILEGKDRAEIKSFLMSKYALSKGMANFVLADAMNRIKARKQWEVTNVIDIHAQRYEEIYKTLMILGAHGMAAQTMKAKERLMQFHKHDTHIKVEQSKLTTVSSMNLSADYDASRLSEDEQKRLDLLLEKIK